MEVTILFGSGADTCVSDELKSGASFSEALLTSKYINQIKEWLGEGIARYRLIHPNSIKPFVQTVYANKEEAKKESHGLGKTDVDQCIKYYEHGTPRNSPEGIEFNKIQQICKKWYSAITSKQTHSEKNQEIKDFFLKHMVFFDTLDGKFNSLRYPYQLTSNGKKAINAYAIVFILMLESLQYNKPKNFSWNYDDIFQLLKQDCGILQGNYNINNYYTILKTALEQGKTKYNIVTTNYTCLAEKLTGRKDIVYLHGRLNWFEDLYHLTVYDCLDEKELEKAKQNKKHLIPFILIPSGVKPLICKKEISEFHRFIEMLDKSERLCVIGYRFNTEDNHINSIIADWLAEDEKHRITYFIYENDDRKLSDINWAEDYKSRIEEKHITGENCADAFKKFIQTLDGAEDSKDSGCKPGN